LNHSNSDYFKELGKYFFAYGINIDANPVIFSLILLFQKEKNYKNAIKNIDISQIKEKCYKLLKSYDEKDYFNLENYIFLVGYEDLVNKPDRANNIILHDKDALYQV
jgi:hypothetical protein